MTTNYASNQLGSRSPGRALTLGPSATRVLLVVFFSVLLLLYLAQSTQGATRQYEVRNLEDSLSLLQQDRAQLDLESVRLQALNAIAPVPKPADRSTTPPSDPKTGSAIQAGDLVPADRMVALPAPTSH